MNRQSPWTPLAFAAFRWLWIACLVLYLAGHVYASSWGIGFIKETQRDRLHGRAGLLFANVLDASFVHSPRLFPDADQLRVLANIENRLGFIHPALFQTPELSKLTNRPQLAGFFDSLTTEGTSGKAFGWAIIPKGFRPADAVLLSYDDPAKGPVAFAIAVPALARRDVAQALADPRYEKSEWFCQFDCSKLVRGQVVTAWAFDAQKFILYPLASPQMLR